MKAFRALLLVLALSISAYAGEMECDRTGYMPNDKAGEMNNGKTGDMPCDLVTAAALQLLQSVLPLF